MKLDLILVHLFYFPNFEWGKNVAIFEVDMNSSVHANNKNEKIVIPVKKKKKDLIILH